MRCLILALSQYTYVRHVHKLEIRSAVGLTQGLVANETYAEKYIRESYFPLPVLANGVSFKCGDANASQQQDKDNIMSAFPHIFLGGSACTHCNCIRRSDR